MKKLNMTKKLLIPISILIIALIVNFALTSTQLNYIDNVTDDALLASDRITSASECKNDYIDWSRNLRQTVESGEAFEGVLDSDESVFGKWINSEEFTNLDNSELQKKIQEFVPTHKALYGSAATINEYIGKSDVDGAGDYFENEVIELVSKAETFFDELESGVLQDSQDINKKLETAITGTKVGVSVVSWIFIIIGVVVSFLVLRQIATRLRNATASLTEAAKVVAGASVTVADAGQLLSEGASEQAASIEETSATMDETSSMVQQNADNTKQANELSKEANDAAEDGLDRMKDMSDSMDELKKSSDEIAKIIKVIDDIAFQTNMLALNAAVEAARAGEAGLGFAVVAEEVRNLAGKSASAAKNTAEIIDKNIGLSERGVTISKDINVSLDAIMNKTQSVNKLMDEITVASEEQARGTAQVTQAIGQMEQVVQANAESAQGSAESADELKAQSKILTDAVFELNKLVRGEETARKAREKYLSENNLFGSNENDDFELQDEIIQLDDNDEF